MTTLIPKFDFMNGGSTPTGAINRAINLKLAETISVTDFGADPTGVTDSTTAIQAAINSVTTGRIYLPAGTYKTTTTISLKNGVSIYGDGSGITTISNATANPIITVNTGANIRFCKINGMTLYGGGTNTYGITANQWGNQDAMIDVEIYNCVVGVYLYACYNFKAENCWIHNNTSHGLLAANATYAAEIRGSMFTQNGGDGVQINTSGGGQFLIENCDFEANSANQINITAGRGINILNNYFEGIQLASGGKYGILVQSADTVWIEGNFWNYSNTNVQTWLYVQGSGTRVNWGRNNSFSSTTTNVTFVNFQSGSGYCQAVLPPPPTGTFANGGNTNRVFYDPYTESGVFVYATAATTLVSSTWTTVTFPTVQQDTKSEWSNPTFTAKDYGDIEFIGAVGIASLATTATVLIRLYDNAAGYEYARIVYANTNNGNNVYPFTFKEMLGNSQNMVIQFQISDATNRSTTATQYTQWMRIRRLS